MTRKQRVDMVLLYLLVTIASSVAQPTSEPNWKYKPPAVGVPISHPLPSILAIKLPVAHVIVFSFVTVTLQVPVTVVLDIEVAVSPTPNERTDWLRTTGFCDLSAFSHAFKKATGFTPKSFRSGYKASCEES